MRLRWLLFPCVLLAAASFVHGGDGKKGKLQGTWTKEKDGKTIELTFADGTFAISFGEKKIKGTYKTDAKKDPKHIDMTIKEGEPKFEGKTAHCIYEVNGDTLKWCANEPGKEGRPEAFPDTEGEGKTLYVIFKRAK